MRPRRLKNEINVVPYIDVMLVLLVIFMVTAPMMQPPGKIDLPSVGEAAQPPSPPLEVIIRADGSLALHDLAKNTPERDIEADDLVDEVQAVQSENPDQPVLIAGNKKLEYSKVMEVMDKLRQQQIKRVGLLVQPTGSK
ncbi:protein TolR [Azospira inquinata]|uniref:Protein TolR n=1 Tax=Azospira inquinata TaxID=2785627 RepID=A0A975SK86_9RHOO|nr:protein TolR [Azospira inquinata]QWT46833.1 protein TolR [Azospira inquinata]QWT47845.1 protein TolR [Azospira inquinata]